MACFLLTEIPLMCQQLAEFHECFNAVEDPRMTAKRPHPLHSRSEGHQWKSTGWQTVSLV